MSIRNTKLSLKLITQTYSTLKKKQQKTKKQKQKTEKTKPAATKTTTTATGENNNNSKLSEAYSEHSQRYRTFCEND